MLMKVRVILKKLFQWNHKITLSVDAVQPTFASILEPCEFPSEKAIVGPKDNGLVEPLSIKTTLFWNAGFPVVG